MKTTLFSKLKKATLVAATILLASPLSSAYAMNTAVPSVLNPKKVKLNDGVVLRKTAKPVVGKVNQWDITLKVSSPVIKTKTVVVIMRSGFGASQLVTDPEKYRDCDYFDNGKKWNDIDELRADYKDYKQGAHNGFYTAHDKLKRCKYEKNVKSLIRGLVGQEGSEVALVSYGGDATVNSGFLGKKDTKELLSRVKVSGGDDTRSFMQAGIRKARNLLRNSGSEVRNIVLVSNGYSDRAYPVEQYHKDVPIENIPSIPGHPNTSYTKTTGVIENESWFDYNDNQVFPDKTWYFRFPGETGHNLAVNYGNNAVSEANFFKKDLEKAKAKGKIYRLDIDTYRGHIFTLENLKDGSNFQNNYYTSKMNSKICGVINQSIVSPDGSPDVNGCKKTIRKDNKDNKVGQARIKGAKVVDRMADGIKATNVLKLVGEGRADITNKGKTLKWIIRNPKLVQKADGTYKYVAKVTYRVRLTKDVLTASHDDNGYYPVNKKAVIRYKVGNKKFKGAFPVPKVDPTFVKVEKVVKNENCDSCKFTFNFDGKKGKCKKATAVANTDDFAVFYHPMKVGKHNIDTDSFEVYGESKDGKEISLNGYNVEVSTNEYELAQGGDDVEIKVTNTKIEPGSGSIVPTIFTKKITDGPKVPAPRLAETGVDMELIAFVALLPLTLGFIGGAYLVLRRSN